MRAKQARVLTIAVFIALILGGCHFPRATPTPDTSGTSVGGTLSALQTSAAMTQTALGIVGTATRGEIATIPAVTPVSSQNTLVTADALCWVGPGNQYEVVSAIRAGTNVQLLGRATIAGWYIVRNPIYGDPCWIVAKDLQISPSVDISGLPYFSPPATPTLTPTDTPIATHTASPSPTNTP